MPICPDDCTQEPPYDDIPYVWIQNSEIKAGVGDPVGAEPSKPYEWLSVGFPRYVRPPRKIDNFYYWFMPRDIKEKYPVKKHKSGEELPDGDWWWWPILK